MKNIHKTGKELYITSDEEIKEGDWYIATDINTSMKYLKVPPLKKDKKIILTTDQDLIKDGVQPIDDDFLEWFVKNPSCEEVKVIKHLLWEEYKIIIPKKEPKIYFKVDYFNP